MNTDVRKALGDAVRLAVADLVAPGGYGRLYLTAQEWGQEIGCRLRAHHERHGVVFPYRWRVKTRLGDRFGLRCRVLARGKKNSCLVEFEDGYRVVTSRNYIRKAAQ